MSDDGVVDEVPTTTDNENNCHQPGRHADNSDHENGEECCDDGVVHTETKVTGPIKQLGNEGEFLFVFHAIYLSDVNNCH